MKDLAKKLYSSKITRFTVPGIFILLFAVYLSFFSPIAIGKDSTTETQPLTPTTSITANSLQEANSGEVSKEESGTKKETKSKSIAEDLISSVALTADSLIGDISDKETADKTTRDTSVEDKETVNVSKLAAHSTSRGTNPPQKQIIAKESEKSLEKPTYNSPQEKTLVANATKTEATEKVEKEETQKLGSESAKETKSAEATNSELFKQDLNSYVLDIIKTYEIGKYPYLLNTDYTNYNGVTTNIEYKGSTIAKANPNGDRASHCVGITFEVFFKAMQKRNQVLGISTDDFNGMSAGDMRNFMLNWFVSDGIKPQQNCSVAIEKYGLGKRIYNLEDAKAGDFIDISRENNTGHTAVFLNWIKKDGKIIGFKYWGSQASTKGIAYKEEYFNLTDSDGKKYGNVMFDQIYIGRVGSVEDYKNYK